MNGAEAYPYLKRGFWVQRKPSESNEIHVYQWREGHLWVARLNKSSGCCETFERCEDFNLLATYQLYHRPNEETGWDRVEMGMCYYRINDRGVVVSCVEEDSDGNRLDYEQANYFTSKSRAKQVANQQALLRKLQRFSALHGTSPRVSEGRGPGSLYYIACDPLTQYVRVHVANERQLGQVYFDSFNTAQEAIQLFKEDILQAFRR